MSTTEIYTLSLHDALPIWTLTIGGGGTDTGLYAVDEGATLNFSGGTRNLNAGRSEEHTSELQSPDQTVSPHQLEEKAASGTTLTLSAGTLNVNNALTAGAL